MMRLISFNGTLRIDAGNTPWVLIEKAAANRVNGLSQAVACRNSFCSELFMVFIFLHQIGEWRGNGFDG